MVVSRIHAICKTIISSFPSLTYLGGGFICNFGRLFVDGVCIERTGYKDACYAWSLTSPAWRFFDEPVLTYSERMAEGRMFEGDPSTVAENIVAEIRSKAVYLNRCTGASTAVADALDWPFLREAHDAARPPLVKFDLGVVQLLNGDTARSKHTLGDFVERRSEYVPGTNLESSIRLAQDLLALKTYDVAHGLALVAEAADENIRQLREGGAKRRASAGAGRPDRRGS